MNNYNKYLIGAKLISFMTKIKEYQRVLQIYNDGKTSLKRTGTSVIEAFRVADRDLKNIFLSF